MDWLPASLPRGGRRGPNKKRGPVFAKSPPNEHALRVRDADAHFLMRYRFAT